MHRNRKFWQNYMPSLKYYNPGVEMDVVRTAEAGGPSTLTIEFGTDRRTDGRTHTPTLKLLANTYRVGQQGDFRPEG